MRPVGSDAGRPHCAFAARELMPLDWQYRGSRSVPNLPHHRPPPRLRGALRSLVNPERVAKHAVSDVSFSVAGGELLALLGPNGAGKSTTIKMLISQGG